MKMPKEVQKYCPKCKKKTKHKVIVVKPTKKRGALSKGARRFDKKIKGCGGFPRPKPENSSKWGVKITKKVDIRYECTVCKRKTPISSGFRIKKLELVK